jgi:hypothetical protein
VWKGFVLGSKNTYVRNYDEYIKYIENYKYSWEDLNPSLFFDFSDYLGSHMENKKKRNE